MLVFFITCVPAPLRRRAVSPSPPHLGALWLLKPITGLQHEEAWRSAARMGPVLGQ
jgi:hypothetical protein